MTTPTPDRQWAITVTIPADRALDRDRLFAAVADVAYEWEPFDRNGWDIEVSGGPVEDLAAEVAALRTQLSVVDAYVQMLCVRAERMRGTPTDLRRRLAELRALTEDTPDTPTELDDDCSSCGEDMPQQECPRSLRECGHHCNHSWSHDLCDWCGERFPAEVLVGAPPVCATCNDTRIVFKFTLPRACPDCTEDTPDA